jgi:hypothetical protein
MPFTTADVASANNMAKWQSICVILVELPIEMVFWT